MRRDPDPALNHVYSRPIHSSITPLSDPPVDRYQQKLKEQSVKAGMDQYQAELRERDAADAVVGMACGNLEEVRLPAFLPLSLSISPPSLPFTISRPLPRPLSREIRHSRIPPLEKGHFIEARSKVCAQQWIISRPWNWGRAADQADLDIGCSR